MDAMQKRRHPSKTTPEWIVWRPSCGEGVTYWDGNGWTLVRANAYKFLDPSEASVLATKHSGVVTRK